VPVTELFHLMHVVDDIDSAQAWLDRLFQPASFGPKGWSPFDKRWATLNRVGPDLVYELMEPSKEAEDASFPLPKFQARFGERLHSLAWYVDEAEMGPLFEKLRGAGIRVARPDGVLYTADEVVDPPPNLIFTHPRDTFGQVELMVRSSDSPMRDPADRPDWQPNRWHEAHPGKLRRVRFTVAVGDLDRGLGFFEGLLGGTRFFDETTADRQSAYVFVGNQTVVELAQPTAEGSRLAADLATNGELPHALTVECADLQGAERHVDSMGLGVVDRAGDSFTIDPSEAFGAVISFTDRSIPGDPRD
jgi:hypothetical protein